MLCHVVTVCGTAVERYIITTAAAVRTESDHYKSTNHLITESKKKRTDFSMGKKEAKEKKLKLDPR